MRATRTPLVIQRYWPLALLTVIVCGPWIVFKTLAERRAAKENER